MTQVVLAVESRAAWVWYDLSLALFWLGLVFLILVSVDLVILHHGRHPREVFTPHRHYRRPERRAVARRRPYA